MKRVIAILLVLLLAVSFVACNKEEGPEDMKNAATENDKFLFYVPNTWYPQKGFASAYFSNADTSNVNVTTYLMEQDYTAESYWTEKAVPELTLALNDFTVLTEQCGDTTLGGIQGKRYVYTSSYGTPRQFMAIIVVKEYMVYTLTYTAKVEHFADHLEDVEEMRIHFSFR